MYEYDIMDTRTYIKIWTIKTRRRVLRFRLFDLTRFIPLS